MILDNLLLRTSGWYYLTRSSTEARVMTLIFFTPNPLHSALTHWNGRKKSLINLRPQQQQQQRQNEVRLLLLPQACRASNLDSCVNSSYTSNREANEGYRASKWHARAGGSMWRAMWPGQWCCRWGLDQEKQRRRPIGLLGVGSGSHSQKSFLEIRVRGRKEKQGSPTRHFAGPGQLYFLRGCHLYKIESHDGSHVESRTQLRPSVWPIECSLSLAISRFRQPFSTSQIGLSRVGNGASSVIWSIF